MSNIFSLLKKPEYIKLAIAPEVLVTLVENGHLHASDFQCLDYDSKRYVWKLLLITAKTKIIDSFSQTTGSSGYAGS